jgi:hypothetical protein
MIYNNYHYLELCVIIHVLLLLVEVFFKGVHLECEKKPIHIIHFIGYLSAKYLPPFYTPVFKTGRIMVYQCPTVRPFHMSRFNLRTPWPIHFKFHRVIGIDGPTV